MRRVTWLVSNPRILMPEHLSEENYFAEWDGKNKINYGALSYHLYRQPMQRTEYYMPWGTVTVDELCKMEYDRSPTILACFDARDDSWFDDDGKLPWQG